MSSTGAKPPAKQDLQTVPMDDLAAAVDSSPKGLSKDEAQKRLAKVGPNALAEKQENPLLKFLSYFWGPIPWMIEIAVILSAVVGHWADFGIIRSRPAAAVHATPDRRCVRCLKHLFPILRDIARAQHAS